MPKYKPFPDIVCQRIRNLVQKQRELEAERKRMFEARDEAKGQLQRLTDGEQTKRAKLEADVGRAVIEIEILAKSEKWCKSELAKSVERADEPGLFDDADIEMPDFSADDGSSGEDGGEDGDDGGHDGEEQTSPRRTVGRPDAGGSGSPAPAPGPDAPQSTPLDLKFPGTFSIVTVPPTGPLRETGLFGTVPCGDRERLDHWIEMAIKSSAFTLGADGVVTSNDVRRLHVTRVGDAPAAAEPHKPAKLTKTAGKRGKPGGKSKAKRGAA